MPTNLREFLQKKTEGTDLKERNRLRSEWLASLNRLFDQIREWLREADPEEVLEVVRYEVERVEQRLGVYDAPALLIRLGTDSVRIVPSGRFEDKYRIQMILAGPSYSPEWGDLCGGRVDVRSEDRRYLLLRSVEGDNEKWFAVSTNENGVAAFNRSRLEAILQELLS
jgi:hypothetical protein